MLLKFNKIKQINILKYAFAFLFLLALNGQNEAQASEKESNKKKIVNSKNVPKSRICIKLNDDYNNLSKEMALLRVEGEDDDSALRATLREQKANNLLVKSGLINQSLKNSGCAMRTDLPNDEDYYESAIKQNEHNQMIRSARAASDAARELDETMKKNEEYQKRVEEYLKKNPN